ncbi:unnamed protein product [Closterium sp. Yama58-4]|nr:unnamed protein product [Closterium sp. Yama58-4]
MRVVETGAVRLLVTCLQDEAVARISLSVPSDVARHSLLHATAVADAGGINAIVTLLGSPDVKTRLQCWTSRERPVCCSACTTPPLPCARQQQRQ